ncbi:unnamed protein product [Amoebophrya sp. A120]|nr:unnamed protein product [Amoebophrya sp. A120]|eukprot:GSA120T00014761001.1
MISSSSTKGAAPPGNSIRGPSMGSRTMASEASSRNSPSFYNALQIPGATNFTQRNSGIAGSAGSGGGSKKSSRKKRRAAQAREQLNDMDGSAGNKAALGGSGQNNEDEIVYDRIKFPVYDMESRETNVWVEFQNHRNGVLDIIIFTETMLCNYLPASIEKDLKFVYYDRGNHNDLKSSNSVFTDFFSDDTNAPHSSNYVAGYMSSQFGNTSTQALLVDLSGGSHHGTSSAGAGGHHGTAGAAGVILGGALDHIGTSSGRGRKRYTSIEDLLEEENKNARTTLAGLNQGANFGSAMHHPGSSSSTVGGEANQNLGSGNMTRPFLEDVDRRVDAQAPPTDEPLYNLADEAFQQLLKPYYISTVFRNRPNNRISGPKVIYSQENSLNLPYPKPGAMEIALDRTNVRCTKEERGSYLNNLKPLYLESVGAPSSAAAAGTTGGTTGPGGGRTGLISSATGGKGNTSMKVGSSSGAPASSITGTSTTSSGSSTTDFVCLTSSLAEVLKRSNNATTNTTAPINPQLYFLSQELARNTGSPGTGRTGATTTSSRAAEDLRLMVLPQERVCAQLVETNPVYLPLDCETQSLMAVYCNKYLSDEEQRVEHLENIGNRGNVEIDVLRKDSVLWRKYDKTRGLAGGGGGSSSTGSFAYSRGGAGGAQSQNMAYQQNAMSYQQNYASHNQYAKVTATTGTNGAGSSGSSAEDQTEELDRITEKVMFGYKITQTHNLDRGLPPLRCINIVPRVLFVNDMAEPVYVRQGSVVSHISWSEKDLHYRDVQDAMREGLPEMVVPGKGGMLPLLRWSMFGKFGIEVRYKEYAYSGSVPCWIPGEYHLVLFDNVWHESPDGILHQNPCNYVTCCIEVTENVTQGTTYMTMHAHYNVRDNEQTSSSASAGGASSAAAEVGSASTAAGGFGSSGTRSTAAATTPQHKGPSPAAPHNLPTPPKPLALTQQKTRNIGTGFQLVNCCENTRIIIRQNLGNNAAQNKLQRGMEWHEKFIKQLNKESQTYKREKNLITEAFKIDPKNLFQLPWIQVPAKESEPLWFGWYEPTLAGRLDVRVGSSRESVTIDMKNQRNHGQIPVQEEVVLGAGATLRRELKRYTVRWELKKIGPVEYLIFWRPSVTSNVDKMKASNRLKISSSSGAKHAPSGPALRQTATPNIPSTSNQVAYAALAPLAHRSMARVFKINCKGIGISLVGKTRKPSKSWADEFFQAMKNTLSSYRKEGACVTMTTTFERIRDALDSYTTKQALLQTRNNAGASSSSSRNSGQSDVNLVDSYANAEILFAYLEEIYTCVNVYPTHNEYDLSIRDLQLDTQARDTHFPVCVARDPSILVSSGGGASGGGSSSSTSGGSSAGPGSGRSGHQQLVQAQHLHLETIQEEAVDGSSSMLGGGPRGGAHNFQDSSETSLVDNERARQIANENQRRREEKTKSEAILHFHVRERTKITAQSLTSSAFNTRERYGKYDILYLDKVRLKIKPVLLMFDLKLVQIMLSLVYKFQAAIEDAMIGGGGGSGASTSFSPAGGGGTAGGLLSAGGGPPGGMVGNKAGARTMPGGGSSSQHPGSSSSAGGAANSKMDKAKNAVRRALHHDVVRSQMKDRTFGHGLHGRSSHSGSLQQQTQYKTFADFFGHLNWKEPNLQSKVQKLVKVFFQDLKFDHMKLTASFDPGEEPQFGLRNALLTKVLTFMSGVESCPLDFDQMTLKETLGQGSGMQSILKAMSEFYKSQCVMQLNRLLMSSNFFGNPQNFLNYVGDGAYAFLKEPYEGFQRGGLEGMAGIGKGTSSLMRNVTTGLADTGAKLIANFNQGLSTISLDSQYSAAGKKNRNQSRAQNVTSLTSRYAEEEDRRRDSGAQGPSTLSELRERHHTEAQSDNSMAIFDGFLRGGESLVKGVADGITGVFSQPYQAATAEDRSLERVATGTARGVAGLFAKPIIGVGEGLKAVMEGIRDQAIGVDDTILRQKARNIPRIRLPRSLYGEDRVLRPYFLGHAKVRLFLAEAFNCEDALLAHRFNKVSQSEVILTEAYIICRIVVQSQNQYGMAVQSSAFDTNTEMLGGSNALSSSSSTTRQHYKWYFAAKDDYDVAITDKTDNERTKLIVSLKDSTEIQLSGSREEMDACKVLFLNHCA